MPKLERWLVAVKDVEVLDPGTRRRITELGGNMGGGWYRIHQHICVNSDNKEKIEEELLLSGYTIINSSDRSFFHPEPYEFEFTNG